MPKTQITENQRVENKTTLPFVLTYRYLAKYNKRIVWLKDFIPFPPENNSPLKEKKRPPG